MRPGIVAVVSVVPRGRQPTRAHAVARLEILALCAIVKFRERLARIVDQTHQKETASVRSQIGIAFLPVLGEVIVPPCMGLILEDLRCPHPFVVSRAYIGQIDASLATKTLIEALSARLPICSAIAILRLARKYMIGIATKATNRPGIENSSARCVHKLQPALITA
jgi:hypothetical protein